MHQIWEEFEEERLREIVRKLSMRRAADVINAIIEEVRKYVEHSQQNDDTTIVLLKTS